MYQSIVSILKGVKSQIIQEYHTKGLKASGGFANNMTVGRQGRYKVVLTLPSYSQYIMKFKGNKGGTDKAPYDLNIIAKWVKDKGLPLRDYLTGRFMPKTDTNLKKVAFLISRKIRAHGTDIKQGKKQPIDLDKILDNQFDYKGEELADRILQDMIKL